MARWLALLSASVAVLACGVAMGDEPSGGKVKLTKEENRVAVTIDGKPFTDYYFGPEGGRPFVRPFMSPVNAADGTNLTSDQINDPSSHPHHRSLWVAHGDVNGADHWTLGKTPDKPESFADLPKQRHVSFDKVEGDTIVENLVWEDKAHQPMLQEKRTVRFLVLPDNERAIDLTSVYSAINSPVKFGDTKEAGLCSIRTAHGISDDPVLTLSTGATSKRNPDKASKDPGDEANVWGKKADWCDISGKIDGKPYGLAILNHPQNPLPARWHARRYGLVGANNIGTAAFDKNDPTAYTPFTIEPGKPVTFRYRVIVHEGGVSAAKVAERYKEYAGG